VAKEIFLIRKNPRLKLFAFISVHSWLKIPNLAIANFIYMDLAIAPTCRKYRG
jgi:hypothetical protein